MTQETSVASPRARWRLWLRLRSVLLLVGMLVVTTSWWPVAHARFPGVEQRFVEEKLINTGSLGLPDDGLVAAFGDFNGDQLLDLFHLSTNQRTVSVYTWSRAQYRWQEQVQARIRTASDFIITNIVPGDFDYDGRLDLLLMGGSKPGGWWGHDELAIKVFLQQRNGTFVEGPPIPTSGLPQPTIFDATGSMRADLLGVSTNSKTMLKLWKNVWTETDRTNLFDLVDPPFKGQNFNCRLPEPHFNAFVDLDGDCLADLFLTCQPDEDAPNRLTYQIWLNDKQGSYRLAREGNLPYGTKSVGFADMDRDGTIDMVITSCSSRGECTLSVAYNEQMPLCGAEMTGSAACREPDALCVADPKFNFDLSTASNPSFTSIPISTLLPGATLITQSTSFRGPHPTPPSIGDYNIDGYPDLLLLTTQAGGGRNVKLLQSRPCDKASCTPGEVKARRRAFAEVTAGAEVLTKIRDAESAHWIDIDDDGSLDIMVQKSSSSVATRKVDFIKNNFFHDAFFMKALTLNGACRAWCEPAGEPRYRPYGASYSGASYKFSVMDPTGARRSTQVAQLPRSTYLSLGTPYSYFGLGRTNNYVENLFIGVTRHQDQHFINIEGLIPNSQIVIVPWQPDWASDPSSWTRELFLHPGDWIPWVTIVLGAATLLLGAIVVSLHFNEKVGTALRVLQALPDAGVRTLIALCPLRSLVSVRGSPPRAPFLR
ncbi:BQ5605_C005g03425 [Microbotryum silenes-dioicae]|uniref:BQ5605_C005g03425 protein n=1 Tax=Microbotryum silenes-dioicae TaxID=796604 RepID=A0A2X0MAL2_9BASI|nr:BQ5605_C005g03425 [Microbotryum silenes-dioicae]